MSKRFRMFVITICFLYIYSNQVLAEPGDIVRIVKNSNTLQCRYDPKMTSNNQVLLSLQDFGSIFNSQVMWNPDTKDFLIVYDDKMIMSSVTQSSAMIAYDANQENWEEFFFDTPVIIDEDVIKIPVTEYCEMLGIEYFLNNDEKYLSMDIPATVPLVDFETVLNTDIIYQIYCGSKQDYQVYSNDILEFYEQRNSIIDLSAMTVSDIWSGFSDLVSGIWGAGNAKNILSDCMKLVFSNIPQEKQFSLPLDDLVTIKDIVSNTNELGEILEAGDLWESIPILHALTNDKAGYMIDFSNFTAEQIAVLCSDYQYNINYISILKHSLAENNIYDENLSYVLDTLENEYSNKYLLVLQNIGDSLPQYVLSEGISGVIQGLTKTVACPDGIGIFSLADFTQSMIFDITGASEQGENLKYFYGLFCINQSLDTAYRRTYQRIIESNYSSDVIEQFRYLNSLERAVKYTTFECIGNITNDIDTMFYTDDVRNAMSKPEKSWPQFLYAPNSLQTSTKNTSMSGDQATFVSTYHDFYISYPKEWADHISFVETSRGLSIFSEDKLACAEMEDYDNGYWRHTSYLIAKIFYDFGNDVDRCYNAISDSYNELYTEDMLWKKGYTRNDLYEISLGNGENYVMYVDQSVEDPDRWPNVEKYLSFANSYKNIVSNFDLIKILAISDDLYSDIVEAVSEEDIGGWVIEEWEDGEDGEDSDWTITAIEDEIPPHVILNDVNPYVSEVASTAEKVAQLTYKLEHDEFLTQADLNQISGQIYQAWDDELNTLWGHLKETLSSEDMEQLTQDEIEWIKQKEEAVQNAGYEGGSMRSMAQAAIAAEWTERRVYELLSVLVDSLDVSENSASLNESSVITESPANTSVATEVYQDPNVLTAISENTGLPFIGGSVYPFSIGYDDSLHLNSPDLFGILGYAILDFDNDKDDEVFIVSCEPSRILNDGTSSVYFSLYKENNGIYKKITDLELVERDWQGNYYSLSGINESLMETEEDIFLRMRNGQIEIYYENFGYGLLASGVDWTFRGYRYDNHQFIPIEETVSIGYGGSPIDELWFEPYYEPMMNKYYSLGFSMDDINIGMLTYQRNPGLQLVTSMFNHCTISSEERNSWLSKHEGELNGFEYRIESSTNVFWKNPEIEEDVDRVDKIISTIDDIEFEDIYEAYKQIIEEANTFPWGYSYICNDLNGDNIPELIVRAESDYSDEIYFTGDIAYVYRYNATSQDVNCIGKIFAGQTFLKMDTSNILASSNADLIYVYDIDNDRVDLREYYEYSMNQEEYDKWMVGVNKYKNGDGEILEFFYGDKQACLDSLSLVLKEVCISDEAIEENDQAWLQDNEETLETITIGGREEHKNASNEIVDDVLKEVEKEVKEYKNSLEDFSKILKEEVEKKAGGTLDEVVKTEAFAEEIRKNGWITISLPEPINHDEKAIKAVYKALAKIYKKLILKTPGFSSIDFSNTSPWGIIMSSTNMIKMVQANLTRIDETLDYDGYTISLNGTGMFSASYGSLVIRDKNGTKTVGAFSSSQEETEKIMNAYMEELSKIVKNESKKALFEVLLEFSDVTGLKSFFDESMETTIRSNIKGLEKSGLKKLLDNYTAMKDIYNEATPILNSLNNPKNLATAIRKNGKDLYETVKQLRIKGSSDWFNNDRAVKTAMNQVEKARKNLEDALFNYIYENQAESPQNDQNVIEWILSLFS